MWKSIWRLHCPGKIKHFLWRLAHNTLALRINLRRKGMDIDTRCVVCNQSYEDEGHLFLNCKYVCKVWQELGMESVRLNLSRSGSAISMLEMILQLEEKERLKAIVLLWYWWLERNRIREGERRRDPSVSAFSITRMTNEFLAIAAEGEKGHRVDRVKARWSRPPVDTLKINSDGVYCAASGTGGWGYVIRDEEGSVIWAGAGRSDYLLDALHAEALGCLQGIRAAGEKGISRAVIETDSAILKSTVESNSYALAATGGLVLEIRNAINSLFSSWSFMYCPRECNGVAHALATHGCKSPAGTVQSWDVMPSVFVNLVASDLAELVS
jgi:hypothetical protein